MRVLGEPLDSVVQGETVFETIWNDAWLAEVERREAFEPDETLGDEHELPAVRRRLLRLAR